jgi:Cu-Zn family superoxide dismutase
MTTHGRHRVGRHRLKPVGEEGFAPMRIAWRRAAAAFVSLGIAAVTFVVLNSPARAAQTVATATLHNAAGVEVGKVVFKGPGKYADRIDVDIVATDAPNLGAFHGLHVHSTGDCNPAPSGATQVPFGSAGGHLGHNAQLPGTTPHGTHLGDLPSVLLTPKGQAYAEFETARFDVGTLLDADGAAVVLHAGPDNFGNIPTVYGLPNAATLGTGDAGGRYACGVIERANELTPVA